MLLLYRFGRSYHFTFMFLFAHILFLSLSYLNSTSFTIILRTGLLYYMNSVKDGKRRAPICFGVQQKLTNDPRKNSTSEYSDELWEDSELRGLAVGKKIICKVSSARQILFSHSSSYAGYSIYGDSTEKKSLKPCTLRVRHACVVHF